MISLIPALVDHIDESLEAGGIQRRQLVPAEQPQHVVPFLMHLDQLDALLVEIIEFLLVPFVRIPGFDAGVFAQVVAAVDREDSW